MRATRSLQAAGWSLSLHNRPTFASWIQKAGVIQRQTGIRFARSQNLHWLKWVGKGSATGEAKAMVSEVETEAVVKEVAKEVAKEV